MNAFYFLFILQIPLYCSTELLVGPYKMAYIAAHQRLLRCRDTLLSLVYCGSCTVAKAAKYIAATVHEPQHMRDNPARVLQLVYCGSLNRRGRACWGCRSLPWWVEFSLPQGRNISPFITSRLWVNILLLLYSRFFIV